MVLVRCAAAAMKTSGEAMISYPAEWCSPNQASSKPSASRCPMSCRSRSSARVGFWPTGWKGARKIPNPRRSAASRLVMSAPSSSLGTYHDLAVLTGAAQRVEGGGRPGQVNRGGHQEIDAGDAVSEPAERGGQL